ncbi:hypothetical protein SB778_37345, partial [Paraburkholderia sp. SIMBA_050]
MKIDSTPKPSPLASTGNGATRAQSGAASSSAQAAGTVRRTSARYKILALLAIGTMINYLDRTVLGVAAPQLTKELGINAA